MDKRMHFLFLCIIFLSVSSPVFSQEKKLYNPEADAASDIRLALAKAASEGKHVLLQGGGNWCGWCIEFARFCKADTAISAVLDKNFVWYHLNYSKENKNGELFARYGYPERFGFPVFIILDAQGRRLHTQNSEYLEDGKKSYDQEKVLTFLKMWTPAALDPASYSNQ
jgi:thioredoxin-related protein